MNIVRCLKSFKEYRQGSFVRQKVGESPCISVVAEASATDRYLLGPPRPPPSKGRRAPHLMSRARTVGTPGIWEVLTFGEYMLR